MNERAPGSQIERGKLLITLLGELKNMELYFRNFGIDLNAYPEYVTIRTTIQQEEQAAAESRNSMRNIEDLYANLLKCLSQIEADLKNVLLFHVRRARKEITRVTLTDQLPPDFEAFIDFTAEKSKDENLEKIYEAAAASVIMGEAAPSDIIKKHIESVKYKIMLILDVAINTFIKKKKLTIEEGQKIQNFIENNINLIIQAMKFDNKHLTEDTNGNSIDIISLQIIFNARNLIQNGGFGPIGKRAKAKRLSLRREISAHKFIVINTAQPKIMPTARQANPPDDAA